MREANDRGYDCLLVEDGTESYFPEFKAQTLAMIAAQGAIVGWHAPSAALLARSRSRARCAAQSPSRAARRVAAFVALRCAGSSTCSWAPDAPIAIRVITTSTPSVHTPIQGIKK